MTDPTAASALVARRALLETEPNPGGKQDYLIRLSGRVAGTDGALEASITVRYVPDKRVLTPEGFGRYFGALGLSDWLSLEALAVAMIDDLKNELVARWTQVAAERIDTPDGTTAHHAILIEDRQPRWDNPALLARIRDV